MVAVAGRARLPAGVDPAAGSVTLTVAGCALTALPSGALWWPGEATLILADMHLEKGSRMAMRGLMVPPYDTGLTLGLIEGLVAALEPKRVISLGDAFDDGGGAVRLELACRERLTAVQAGRDWIWIAGNHDPRLEADVGGIETDELAIGPLVFRHEPRQGAAPGEIAGHLHPAARVFLGPKSVRRRCFVCDGERLILPALGAYAGGLSVTDPAFHGLFRREALSVALLGDGRVYSFPRRMLSAG
ncbi:MAG: ligase-associated DNA damage response endonuclease PdeM [Ancalomicrobiaceae bacterium]|nr:ligase-associated DNA damage response endonuclease PdeM [Ancalomicrobiaceae bacterium]